MIERERGDQLPHRDRGERDRGAEPRGEHDADDDEERADDAADPRPRRHAPEAAQDRSRLTRRERDDDEQHEADDELRDRGPHGRPERQAQPRVGQRLHRDGGAGHQGDGEIQRVHGWCACKCARFRITRQAGPGRTRQRRTAVAGGTGCRIGWPMPGTLVTDSSPPAAAARDAYGPTSTRYSVAPLRIVLAFVNAVNPRALS